MICQEINLVLACGSGCWAAQRQGYHAVSEYLVLPQLTAERARDKDNQPETKTDSLITTSSCGNWSSPKKARIHSRRGPCPLLTTPFRPAFHHHHSGNHTSAHILERTDYIPTTAGRQVEKAATSYVLSPSACQLVPKPSVSDFKRPTLHMMTKVQDRWEPEKLLAVGLSLQFRLSTLE